MRLRVALLRLLLVIVRWMDEGGLVLGWEVVSMTLPRASCLTDIV